MDEAQKGDNERVNQWTKLCSLVKKIHDDSLLDSVAMKMCLDINLLCGAGIWRDEQSFKTRLVKYNTQLMYKQQKYNLFREESEGYAKLITSLSALPPPPHQVSDVTKHLISIIGYFDLDPNRAADVALDCFEQDLWNPNFIPVLQMFNAEHIVHLVGFKLSHYHDEAAGAAPRSL